MSSVTGQSDGGRVRFGRRGRRWEIPIGQRPVTATRSGSAFGGVFMVVFALLWGGLPTAGLLANGLPSADQPASWLFLLFPAIALGLFLFGVHQLIWSRTITLDDLFVTVEERGLFGSETWQEPLTSYRGVLSRSRRVRTKNSSYTLYLVDLLHPDRGRTINLYTAAGEGGWRAKWEAYARWLRLPAVQQDVGGVVARDVEDLDKPVAALIQEGKIDVDYERLRERAEGLAVDIEGDAVVVTRTGPELPWWGALFLVLFPLVFVYVGFFLDDVPRGFGWIFGTIGLLFEALILAGVTWDIIARQRLRIDPRRITANAIGPWGETKGRSLAIAEVEEVRVGRDRGNNDGRALLVTGDRGRLVFGRRLPRDTLGFLAHLVLAKIAKHHDAG